jgi:hypothetical protein
VSRITLQRFCRSGWSASITGRTRIRQSKGPVSIETRGSEVIRRHLAFEESGTPRRQRPGGKRKTPNWPTPPAIGEPERSPQSGRLFSGMRGRVGRARGTYEGPWSAYLTIIVSEVDATADEVAIIAVFPGSPVDSTVVRSPMVVFEVRSNSMRAVTYHVAWTRRQNAKLLPFPMSGSRLSVSLVRPVRHSRLE